jgi:putative membrane protein
MRRTRLALSVIVLAAVLAGCKDPAERVPDAQSAGANSSGTGEYGAPAAAVADQPPGAVGPATPPGAAATAALAEPDQQFLAQAAEGGQFEVEIAKLALEKASDPSVKAFAQMLVDDHGAANDKLRQIATGHNLALPAALPEAKKRELEQLAQLSGAAFDREFVRMVGIQDHRHDIAEFEKASQAAQAPDVKSFAQSTLPTLKKHLASAQKLPGAGPAKG